MIGAKLPVYRSLANIQTLRSKKLDHYKWTPMLRKVARHLLLGYSNEKIAQTLDRGLLNIKHRVMAIADMVGALNRVEAVKVILHDEELLREIYEI